MNLLPRRLEKRLRRLIVALCALAMVPAVTVMSPTRLHAQERHVFNPPGTPTNLPFSNGIQVGDMLYIAGMQGEVSGNIESETRTALANLKKVLDAAGFTPGDVVQVTVYLKDIGEFPKMNAVYREFFPDPKPTRTTVEVARLVNDARIEITSVALRSHGRQGARPAVDGATTGRAANGGAGGEADRGGVR